MPRSKPAFRLTGRLGELAKYMAARRWQPVFLPELLVNVFGHAADSRSWTVDTHIYRLTTVVGDAEEIFSIRSRRRRGYMLAAAEVKL